MKTKVWRIELPDGCSLVKKEPFGSLTLVQNKYTVFDSPDDISNEEFIKLVESALDKRFSTKSDVYVVDSEKNKFKMTFKYKKKRINFDVVLLRHIKK